MEITTRNSMRVKALFLDMGLPFLQMVEASSRLLPIEGFYRFGSIDSRP